MGWVSGFDKLDRTQEVQKIFTSVPHANKDDGNHKSRRSCNNRNKDARN